MQHALLCVRVVRVRACVPLCATEYASTQVVDVWVPLENVECGELHFQILYRTFADDLQKSFQAIESTPPPTPSHYANS